jgi:hypothetical protein
MKLVAPADRRHRQVPAAGCGAADGRQHGDQRHQAAAAVAGLAAAQRAHQADGQRSAHGRGEQLPAAAILSFETLDLLVEAWLCCAVHDGLW